MDPIKESFKRVKEDFEKRDAEISKLKEELAELKRQVNEILPALLETNRLILARLDDIEGKLAVRHDPLKKQLISKYKRKRKEVVMKKILELVASQEFSLPELKALIVDELGYCSKSSFYRYIDYLAELDQIDFVNVNGTIIVKFLSQKESQ